MKVKLTLTEEMLGTKAANKDVFADFIASKHPSGTPQKDELDKAEHREEAGTTIFHRDNDVPILVNYMIKGFFKDACGAMNRMDTDIRKSFLTQPPKEFEKLSAYKSKIDGCIFIEPRFIPIILPAGLKVGVCERPLRADTAQGPRVSLCRSETVPAGSTMEFTIQILVKDLKPHVEAWLNYGKLKGLGVWRNSGKGAFIWGETK